MTRPTSASDRPWPIDERLRWLRRFRAAVAARETDLRDLICEETGKPPFEALTADIMPLLAACRWNERNARRLLRTRRLTGRAWWQLELSSRVQREPLGSVAIIATWNYPVQLLGIQLVQALVAGNRVTVKPSEVTPRTQEYLLQLAVHASLPADQLRWVAATREAGRDLLSGERFDHVLFTGSTSVGEAIAAWGARTLTPTTLELSGRDSAFVLADAVPEDAAAILWAAVTANAGQTCMAPRRILVDGAIYPRFIACLAPLAAAARPLPLCDAAAADRTFSLAKDAIARGGRSLSGVLEPPLATDPRRLRPLVIADCPDDAPLVDGDHFGPAVAIVRTASLDHALEVHARCDAYLATSVFTRRPAHHADLVHRLRSSNVTFNDCVRPVGHPGAALGGQRASGWGISRGEAGLLALTRPVHVARTRPGLRAPDAPPAPAGAARLASLIRWWYGASRAPHDTPRPVPSPADRPALAAPLPAKIPDPQPQTSADSLETARHG